MPIYDYQCLACAKLWQEELGISQYTGDRAVTCPQCQAVARSQDVRVLCGRIGKIIIGVGKGNYGRG